MTLEPEIIGFMVKKSLTVRGVAYIRNRLFQAFLKNRVHHLSDPRFPNGFSVKRGQKGCRRERMDLPHRKGRVDGQDLVSKYLRKERILWMSAEEVS
jgi:hypothetical protein